MKQLLAIIALLVVGHANASQVGASHGNHGGGGFGPSGGQAAAGQAASVGSKGAAQSGSNGGRYSMVDSYQPWPQSEMQQFAKPHFETYTGK